MKRFQRLEEDFWKKKSGVRWFKDRDRNTKFFHSYVKRSYKRLHMSEIQDEQREVLNSQGKIGDTAICFLKNQFIEDTQNDNFEMVENIPTLITEADNVEMCKLPNNDEVVEAMFNLKLDSMCGPDGFTGSFFQSC